MLFLDEPTTGLDPSARALMWDIVRQLVADGTTLLLTTQYLDEADQLAGRIAVIDGGKVIAEGTPAELKASVGGQRRAARRWPTRADAAGRGEGARPVRDHARSARPAAHGSLEVPVARRRTGWPPRCCARWTRPASR